MTAVAAIASMAMLIMRSARRRVDRRGYLSVGAQQVLAAGDQPGLHGGGSAALDQQPGLDPGLAADQPGQVGAGLVVADDGDQRDRGAECGEVAHEVAGATGIGDLAVDAEDRDGASGLMRVTWP